MKVLSFSLNDEAPVEAVSAALTAPVRLIATIITASICNCETTLILVFMTLLGCFAGDTPASNTNRRRPARWTRNNYGSWLAGLVRYDSEIFRSYERSTRWATSR